MKQSQWNEVNDIPTSDNIKKVLLTDHKPVYKMIQKILSVKQETNNRSADQILFDIMEKKQKISLKISDIIKESSVDCIQHTRDNTDLNQKCLRFSQQVENEEAHFPGVTSTELNKIDIKQFQANFKIFQEPDVFVISAKQDSEDIFIYYKVDNVGKDIDIRYIRENGSRICDYDPTRNIYISYETSSHPKNKILGSKFSVFQSLYSVPDTIYKNKIQKNLFPKIDEMLVRDNLQGYVIKYNVTERLFTLHYRISQLQKYMTMSSIKRIMNQYV